MEDAKKDSENDDNNELDFEPQLKHMSNSNPPENKIVGKDQSFNIVLKFLTRRRAKNKKKISMDIDEELDKPDNIIKSQSMKLDF